MLRPPINMTELSAAFERPEGTEAYLDKETGEIVYLSEDEEWAYRSFEDDDDGPEEGRRERLIAWLPTSDVPEWEHDLVVKYHDFRTRPARRFVDIPRHESSDGYRLMCDFFGTVEDERLRELLAVALDGRGAFRRFKDVLAGYPEERERWFEFRDAAQDEDIEDWLHDVFEDWDDEEEGDEEN